MLDKLVYKGTIRHRRFTPKKHQFSYQLIMFCFDIGKLAQSFEGIKQLSIESFNWFSYRRKYYLNDSQLALDACARQLIKTKFASYPQGKILLLTNLTSLGYCFNPISLYLVFDASNQHIDYLIIEVTNTPWGEKHNYVLKTLAMPKKNVYRYQFKKELHVSPFMAMQYEYYLRLKFVHNDIIVHMENRVNGKKDFDATLQLQALPVKQIPRRYALITYKVIVAIYWQALKLWIKKIPIYSHPKTNKRT